MECKQICIEDSIYPNNLRKIQKPPEKLYCIGNLELLKKPGIAIVGTRNITEYGKEMGKYFATELAKKFVIISGMAIGADTIAHKSALGISCETIAVLGSGFNHIFPKENIDLFHEIIHKNGLVISEYSPKTHPSSRNFPERNRIVSGLSEGVLVIEAGYRSGTSITVKYAKKQNKKVFAIPGSLNNKYGVGVNRMIKEGAILVTKIEDVLEHYPQVIEKMWKTEEENREIKKEYKKIYEMLLKKEMNLEEIYINSKEKDIRKIMNLLTMMEIEEIIEQDIGKGYKIKKKVEK